MSLNPLCHRNSVHWLKSKDPWGQVFYINYQFCQKLLMKVRFFYLQCLTTVTGEEFDSDELKQVNICACTVIMQSVFVGPRCEA